MATIQKLLLCGLRSFGPEEEDVQIIKFSSPLTLILGENGCGKTTIIEALNFACSGEVPGGSRGGQTFVKNPKLSTISSIKGQVRLSLANPKGDKFVVVKSVQLMNRGQTLAFRRLDSTLKRIKPDNTSEDLSSRCGDLDAVVCDILGVSKTILSNVIFCHQENTSWPLDEPKKLKEKFDEIFGATKYNKCTEITLKIIKRKKETIKVLSEKVKTAEVIKNHADKKRAELEEKKEELTKFEEIIKEKNDSLVPICKRLQEICELEVNLGNLQRNCTQKETTRKAIREQQEDILKNIHEEFKGSDEDLQNEIASFEANRKKINENLITLDKQKAKTEIEQRNLSKLIDKLQIKLGKLQGEKNQYQDTISERNNSIQKLANTLNLNVSDDLSTNEGLMSILKSFTGNLENSRKSFDALSRKCDEEETHLQATINASRDKLIKVNHDIESKKQQIQELKIKTRDIDSQLRDLDCSDEQLKSLQMKIGRIDTDLKKWKESFNIEEVSKRISDDKQKLRENEENLETLEREYKILQQNCITEAEMETQKHELTKRESEIRKLKNKHFDDFNKIFGNDFPNVELYKKTVEMQKKVNLNKVNALNKKILLKQREVTTTETKCKFQNDKLKSLEKELHDSEKQIYEMCKGKPFDKVSLELQQTIEKLQKDKGQYSSAKTMYEKFVQEFQTPKPCCPICQTGFGGKQSAVQEIVTNIKKKIQGIPQKLREVEEELTLKEQQYRALLQLKPVNSKVEELNSALIPNVQEELIEINAVHQAALQELNDLNEELSIPQSIVDVCDAVLGDSALIDQHQREINRSQNKIKELEFQLVQVPSNRSRQQAEAEIEDLKVDLNNTRRNCEASQKKLQQHNDRCQELREERSKHVEKQLQLQKAMQGKPQLQEQLTELARKEETLTANIAELQIQVNPLKEELRQAEESKDAMKSTNKKKLSAAQNELHLTQNSLDNINKLQRKVEFFIEQNINGKFEDALNEHTELKGQEELLEKRKTEILKSITEVNKQLATQDGGFRTLTDNQALRDKRKEEQVLAGQIATLKKQIGNHNYSTVLAEKQRLTQEEYEIRGEIAECRGRNDLLKSTVEKLKKELNSPENKQAFTNYKKLVIDYAVSKKVLEDLQMYVQALDFAILKFHQERMAQINKIIRQLWRSIYRGNDIDYIEIKTDEVKDTGNRRTYNYKVVQMKTTAEIDMRGCCSAGQKVLACLIIRMALSETFTRNCGILALDEPTTNLDKANIGSLCAALARLINSRQAESNFQLIIITHDEEFISALNQSIDKVSYVWRVTRNDDGNSIITQEMLP